MRVVNRVDLIQKYGPWSLVTGASSGLGEAFARRLAAEGFNLVLVARRGALLEALAEELRQNFKVETRCLALDLTAEAIAQQIFESCKGIEIGLLVNNAGSGVPGHFVTSDLAEESRLLRLNCLAPMQLTRHFLPGMQARGRGGVIFVSSLMGFQGVPFMAHYSATKAYLLNLGEALHHECAGTGVDVMVLAPGATDTPGKDLHPVDYQKLPIHWMPPERVVDEALKGLPRRVFLIPGWRNHFTACLSGGLWTRGFVQKVMARLAKMVLPEHR